MVSGLIGKELEVGMGMDRGERTREGVASTLCDSIAGFEWRFACTNAHISANHREDGMERTFKDDPNRI